MSIKKLADVCTRVDCLLDTPKLSSLIAKIVMLHGDQNCLAIEMDDLFLHGVDTSMEIVLSRRWQGREKKL